jgi:hypothetical protein
VGKGERGGKWNGGTAAAIALRPILAYARTRGVDVEALRVELGVPASALDDPDFRIPEATHDRAWREAATRSGDSAFALHVVEHSSVGAFDVLDYAMWCSRTLAEAIDRLMTSTASSAMPSSSGSRCAPVWRASGFRAGATVVTPRRSPSRSSSRARER